MLASQKQLVSCSIAKVAKAAEVSVATVSRTFNFPQQVNAITRNKILICAERLGYQPNASARTLRTNRSRTIGVVLPTLRNPVFCECLEGIAKAAVTAGYSIVPMTTDYVQGRETLSASLLMAARVDAMILVVSRPETSLALERVRQAGLPYVLVYNDNGAHPCVTVDSRLAVARMVDHMASLGHERFGMISGPLSASDRALQRFRGLEQALARHGLPEPTLAEVPFIAERSSTHQDAVNQMLFKQPRPSMLFCSNDLLAIRTLRAVQQAGLRVPQDISIAGFDGIELIEHTYPKLATIAQPNEAMGCTAVQLLIQALANGTHLSAANTVLLEPEWRIGESAGVAPILSSTNTVSFLKLRSSS